MKSVLAYLGRRFLEPGTYLQLAQAATASMYLEGAPRVISFLIAAVGVLIPESWLAPRAAAETAS